MDWKEDHFDKAHTVGAVSRHSAAVVVNLILSLFSNKNRRPVIPCCWRTKYGIYILNDRKTGGGYEYPPQSVHTYYSSTHTHLAALCRITQTCTS